jgi:hypothetical protein
MSGGSKKTTSNSNTSTSQTLNPWSQQKWQGQYDNIQNTMKETPFDAYTKPLVAGLSDREQAARSAFEGNMGSFQPGLNEAQDAIRNAGTYADFGGVSDQYMNPYQKDVVDVAVGDIGRYNDERNAASKETALANKAYGGSGYQVAEALNNEASMREVARTSADLNYKGYNDAREYYGQDQENGISRAMQIAGLGVDGYNMRNAEASTLNNYGEVDRGIQQDTMGADYNEFLRQQQDWWQRLQTQQALLGQIPMLTNSTGRSSGSSTEKTNPGVMGVLGAAAGIGSMFVPGGGFAGLLSGGMKTAGTPATYSVGDNGVYDFSGALKGS